MKTGTTIALLCACLAPAPMFAQQPSLTRAIPIGARSPIATQTDAKAFVVHTARDTPGNVIRDVVFGSVGGAAIGVLIGSSTNKASREDRELAELSGGILGAGIGAVVGAAIGLTHRTERSTRVSLSH